MARLPQFPCESCGAQVYAMSQAWGTCPLCETPLGKTNRIRKVKAKKSAKARLRANRRRRVLERDGGRCVECGATSHLTLDHVIPRSKGGPNAVENLQAMCAPCNAAKADALPLGA